MQLPSLIPLFGAIFNALVGVFVFSRAPKNSVNRIYCSLSICITVWNLGTYFMFAVRDAERALFWARFLQYGVIFIPILLCHISLVIGAFYNGIWRTVIPSSYIFGFSLAVLNFAGYFVSGVRNAGYAYYGIAGPAFAAFPLLFSLSFVSLFALAKRRRQLAPLHQRRLFPLFAAQTLLCALGLNDILPILGIFQYPGTHVGVYPFGSLGAVFYGLIVGYSVLQHQLLNVQVVLSRVAAHVIRIVFLMALAFILIVLASTFVPSSFNAISAALSLAIFFLSAVFGSILFPRLFGAGTNGIESFLLGDRFEYHDRIKSFNDSVKDLNDLDVLLDELHTLLVGIVGVNSYCVVLFNDTRRQFEVIRDHPRDVQRDQAAEFLTKGSLVFSSLQESGSTYLARAASINAVSDDKEHEIQVLLSDFGAELLLPLFSEDEPFGLLFLGQKMSGDPVTPTDISLLAQMTQAVSIGINQIRLKNRILQAQELDLLGRMSRGMAHDLNNLLTPVHTLLQLVNEGVAADQLDDLLPAAHRNVATMRAYIREALFFSQNLRPDFQLGRLDVIVQNALLIVRERAQKRDIELAAETQSEARLEIDSVLIERLMTNLISNAVDASPPRAKVKVSYQNLPKADGKQEWWRISVEDQGSGISEENLNRIFTPYFTTKQTGDESRGFGLGLAICRKIVHLHGGSLNVTSREGSGTSVQVDLPASRSNDQRSASQRV